MLMKTLVYIASQDREGGILCCTLEADGSLHQLRRYALDRPAYLCSGQGRLHALLREPFQMQSGIVSFQMERDGSLTGQSEVQPVHGTIAAHIFCREGEVYCANYLSGTVTQMPNRLVAFNGSGPNKERQDCSHPHCITETPDGAFLCVCDLGADSIYVLTPELEFVSLLRLPEGSGPRHLVFSKDGEYAWCSNELNSTVSVLGYRQGRLSYFASYPTVPDGFPGPNAASAIRLSPGGQHLYVSNRGHDSIAEFAVEGQELHLLRCIPCHGKSPRDFILTGSWILSANENSDTVTVLPLNTEAPAPAGSFPVKRPWCILPLRLE